MNKSEKKSLEVRGRIRDFIAEFCASSVIDGCNFTTAINIGKKHLIYPSTYYNVIEYLTKQGVIKVENTTHFKWVLNLGDTDFTELAKLSHQFSKDKASEYSKNRYKEKQLIKGSKTIVDSQVSSRSKSEPVAIPVETRVVKKNERFLPDDKCYVIHHDMIYEGRIRAMELHDDNRMRYKVKITMLGIHYTFIERWNNEVFHNAKDIADKLMKIIREFNPNAQQEKSADFKPQITIKENE